MNPTPPYISTYNCYHSNQFYDMQAISISNPLKPSTGKSRKWPEFVRRYNLDFADPSCPNGITGGHLFWNFHRSSIVVYSTVSSSEECRNLALLTWSIRSLRRTRITTLPPEWRTPYQICNYSLLLSDSKESKRLQLHLFCIAEQSSSS